MFYSDEAFWSTWLIVHENDTTSFQSSFIQEKNPIQNQGCLKHGSFNIVNELTINQTFHAFPCHKCSWC